MTRLHLALVILAVWATVAPAVAVVAGRMCAAAGRALEDRHEPEEGRS